MGSPAFARRILDSTEGLPGVRRGRALGRRERRAVLDQSSERLSSAFAGGRDSTVLTLVSGHSNVSRTPSTGPHQSPAYGPTRPSPATHLRSRAGRAQLSSMTPRHDPAPSPRRPSSCRRSRARGGCRCRASRPPGACPSRPEPVFTDLSTGAPGSGITHVHDGGPRWSRGWFAV
jgi:hypothetical protein